MQSRHLDQDGKTVVQIVGIATAALSATAIVLLINWRSPGEEGQHPRACRAAVTAEAVRRAAVEAQATISTSWSTHR